MRPPSARVFAPNLAATTSSSARRHTHLSPALTRRINTGEQASSASSSNASNVEPELKPTQATSTAAEKEQAQVKNDKNGIPFLNQPLGVKEPPTGKKQNWTDIIWNDDLRAKQRGALINEVKKGNYDDLNATRHHGGKMWVAPPVLIRESKARYFPDIAGTSLATKDKVYTTDLLLKKVSLISMLSTKISEIQTHMFTEPTCAQYSADPHFQHIKINLQENKMRSVLVSFFANSIRKTMPQEEWPFYLISSQNMDYIREDIGLGNKYIGYVYLVDDQCRVRWAGCADPQPGEIQALRVCTGQLLQRYK
ncbi:ATP10 protein-domain-containing protein [Cytidiella melzeri]|nr:ATP10 protein-domain-containing protein [Cytidiella melzeri]